MLALQRSTRLSSSRSIAVRLAGVSSSSAQHDRRPSRPFSQWPRHAAFHRSFHDAFHRSFHDAFHRNLHRNLHRNFHGMASLGMLAAAATLASGVGTHCESLPVDHKDEPGDEPEDDDDDDHLPTFRMSSVKLNDGKNDKNGHQGRVWMTYGGYVYDVTDFIANHPGGSEKILLAAGGAIEPHWHLYRQHFASDLPQRLMQKMKIGKLHPTDQEQVDAMMEQLTDSEHDDPYANEPNRHPSLHVHSDTPMNAEVPSHTITEQYLTSNDLFYIRHHHPVPLLSQQQALNYQLEIDLSQLFSPNNNNNNNNNATTTASLDDNTNKDTKVVKLSLEQIKSLPKVEVTTTLQCSGNRRGHFNEVRRTSGTPWGQGAISTAKWGGAKLSDVLLLASRTVDESNRPSSSTKKKSKRTLTPANIHSKMHSSNIHHLRMESLDGMLASIDIPKALSPYGDVILAYEMNDEPLPRDHGYPLRVIVPGYAAVRNVKWLSKLELSNEEALGAWQRGLNYKILPPSVTDAKTVDLDTMPGLGEVSVFSGITHIERTTKEVKDDVVYVKASGWAWAGGGRNVVRVDLTGNGGKSWSTARITHGKHQPYGQAWAWVFWTCDNVPANVNHDGTIELSSKAVDMAFNSQPEDCGHLWNVRGLANNSWFKVKHQLA